MEAQPLPQAPADAPRADLLVYGARLLATMDATMDAGPREIEGGWVAVTAGFISGVGGLAIRILRSLPRVNASTPQAASSPPAWSTRITTSSRTSPAPIPP